MMNHSAATFSSQSDGVDVADAQPKAVKGKGKTVQPAANRARTKGVTVLGDDPDDEAVKDRDTVLCVWMLTGIRDCKDSWQSGPKDIVTMSDSSKFEHLLPTKLQELAATCGQPSRTPFPRPANSLHRKYQNLLGEYKTVKLVQKGSSGEATWYLEANDEEKWTMLAQNPIPGEERFTKAGNPRKHPKTLLHDSMDIYRLMEEIKGSDVDIHPAAVTSVGIGSMETHTAASSKDLTARG
ncbi:hypothetical protein WJX77_005856 [Trebouxia sp. C0004]